MKDYYKVHCGRLRSNGLRFYTQYDRSDSRELALIVVMVGSIHDPPNRRGLSHLTEHVICAESKAHTAQQVESIMARTLGSESALITTSKTVTTYGPADLLKKSHNRKLHNRGDKLLSYLKRGGRSRLREIAQKYFYKKSACIIVKPS